MEKVIMLDTHAVVWLYTGHLKNFPARVQKLLSYETLAICPMVILELEYMYEIGRSKVTGTRIVDMLARETGLKVMNPPLEEIIRASLELSWTRDLFDRLIVAHAIHAQSSLITKDETIRKHYKKAVWD